MGAAIPIKQGTLYFGVLQRSFSSTLYYAEYVMDALSCTSGGPAAYLGRQRQRLDALVSHARRRTPIYRERFRGLPDHPRLEDVAPLRRSEILARFDECVTDPAVRLDRVGEHINSKELAGRRFIGRYHLWTTSGSSGIPLPVIHDPEAVTLYQALTAARGWLPWVTRASLLGRLRLLDRVAVVTTRSPLGHSAALANMSRSRRPWPFNNVRAFCLLDPISEIVTQLNRFQPAELISYTSGLLQLCEERRMGRLQIDPVLVATGGETVTAADRTEIETVFGVPLRENYGALEFPRFAWSCRQGRLHVSADWVILEPVDENDRPVPLGEPSATVLVTNLANRVQPIIRYDLGDRVKMYAGPCPCGNPLPAIAVQGRSPQVLKLRSSNGALVPLLPLPLSGLVGDTPGVQRFQIVQTGPAVLTVRLATSPAANLECIRQSIRDTLRQHLSRHDLDNVQVVLSPEPPQIRSASGKLQTVYADLTGPG